MINAFDLVRHGVRKVRRSFARRKPLHPIDRKYGIETTAILTPRELAVGGDLDRYNIGYVGAQPSVVRKCLDLLPIDRNTAFVDLGCGKGRMIAVASEFPFGQIDGVEFSRRIFGVAEKNIATIKAKNSGASIRLILGDATVFPDPGTDTIVLFLYNSFDRPLVEKLIAHIESGVARRAKVFLIYYNPVHFEAFDQSTSLTRVFADKIAFDEDERASAPFDNLFDSVVMYQNFKEPMLPVMPNAMAQIRITVPKLGAEVVTAAPESEADVDRQFGLQKSSSARKDRKSS